MRRLSVMIPCALLVFAFCSKKSNGGGSTISIQPPVDKNWKFETTPAWSDEFDYSGLPNSSKWGYDIGGSGWGNNELQYYTDVINNAKVENGMLTITARKETMANRNYTSARLVTRNKGDFLYGRVEVRAKRYGLNFRQDAAPGLPYGCCPQTGHMATGRNRARSISWNTWVTIRTMYCSASIPRHITTASGRKKAADRIFLQPFLIFINTVLTGPLTRSADISMISWCSPL
jgi:hypothetical protein